MPTTSEDRIKKMAEIMVAGALRRQASFKMPLPELVDGEVVEAEETDEDE
jgi:hypothetical protein